MGTVGAKPFGVAGTVHGGRHDAPVIGDEAAGGAHPAVVARCYPVDLALAAVLEQRLPRVDERGHLIIAPPAACPLRRLIGRSHGEDGRRPAGAGAWWFWWRGLGEV